MSSQAHQGDPVGAGLQADAPDRLVASENIAEEGCVAWAM